MNNDYAAIPHWKFWLWTICTCGLALIILLPISAYRLKKRVKNRVMGRGIHSNENKQEMDIQAHVEAAKYIAELNNEDFGNDSLADLDQKINELMARRQRLAELTDLEHQYNAAAGTKNGVALDTDFRAPVHKSVNSHA